MNMQFCFVLLKFLLVSRYLTGIGCRLDLENSFLVLFLFMLYLLFKLEKTRAEFWSFPNSRLAFHIAKASQIVLYACGSEYDDTIRKTILGERERTIHCWEFGILLAETGPK
jgi:hypothetical protein